MMICKISNWLLSVVIVVIALGLLIGIRPIIILSGSMHPAIETGSLCLVNTNIEYNKIEPEDIITFSLMDTKVTHRAKEITKEGILTKGDANDVKDLGVVTEETYYGKVVWTLPYVGFLFQYIKSHMAIVIALIIAIIMPWKKISKIKKRKVMREGLKNEI